MKCPDCEREASPITGRCELCEMVKKNQEASFYKKKELENQGDYRNFSTSKRKKRLLYFVVALVVCFILVRLVEQINGYSSRTQSTSSFISAVEATNHVGEYTTVRLHVGYTFTDNAGTEFLDQFQNYKNGFVVTIYQSELSNFAFDPASLSGTTVDVTGTITTYDGYIEILNPESITPVN